MIKLLSLGPPWPSACDLRLEQLVVITWEDSACDLQFGQLVAYEKIKGAVLAICDLDSPLSKNYLGGQRLRFALFKLFEPAPGLHLLISKQNRIIAYFSKGSS